MTFDLFDYCDEHGRNDFKAWTKALQSVQRGKLNAKLDMLTQLGCDLLPEILTGTGTPGIFKLRVKGNVQLRPMLCRGPVDITGEFTLLQGATEVGGKLKPKNADKLAGRLRRHVKSDPSKRRVAHERVR